MKVLGLFILAFFTLPSVSAQTVHPMSDPDLIFGKVAQVKEIFYLEPKPGAPIDTLEKRITWYDEAGNTQALEKAIHTKTGWAPSPNEFVIRLTKFGNPPMTTGKDSIDFRLMYDSLGHEVERDNYSADGKLYSKILFYYNADGSIKKSELYTNGSLFLITDHFYEQNRLIKDRISFPNHSVYSITYKYDGADEHNNWLKRTRTLNAGGKTPRVEVTERRVIVYP